MTEVTYSITIHDLLRIERDQKCADEAIVAIKSGDREIHREYFAGICEAASGYTRRYKGKPGLTAVLLSGSCRMKFEAGNLTQDAQGRL
ncbi:hypothetical protein [Pseudomonas putida]|uniref:hypothetical protein n=1 Tax=Pseudomonas putida TaxID=303 RepID=UPI00357160B6